MCIYFSNIFDQVLQPQLAGEKGSNIKKQQGFKFPKSNNYIFNKQRKSSDNNL